MTDATDYAAQVNAAALRMLQVKGHAGCGTGWFMDSQEGLICSCGEILGHITPEVPAPAANLPAVRQHGSVPDAHDPLGSPATIVDPEVPYSLADVEAEILRCVRRLEGGIRFEVQIIERAEELELEYQTAYARALLEAAQEPGAADVRDAKALLATSELRGKAQLAKTMVKTTKAAMHNIRATLSGLQTVAGSIKATYYSGGSNGPTPARRPH